MALKTPPRVGGVFAVLQAARHLTAPAAISKNAPFSADAGERT
jgi:hypothetical protein